MEVILPLLFMLAMLWLWGSLAFETYRKLSGRRAVQQAEIEGLVRKIQRQQVADWEAQFPRWRWYVLDKLPSDQWPNPAKYGPARQPCTHPSVVTLSTWGKPPEQKCTHCGKVVMQGALPGYSQGGAVIGKVMDTTGPIYYDRDTGVHLADICPCGGCNARRQQLATKKSPQGHSLLYCNCWGCTDLRKELLR